MLHGVSQMLGAAARVNTRPFPTSAFCQPGLAGPPVDTVPHQQSMCGTKGLCQQGDAERSPQRLHAVGLQGDFEVQAGAGVFARACRHDARGPNMCSNR
jgi:hypothetical protein